MEQWNVERCIAEMYEREREREREPFVGMRAHVSINAVVRVGVFVLFQCFVRKVVCATAMYRSGSGQPKR